MIIDRDSMRLRGKYRTLLPTYLRNIENAKKEKKSWYQYVFLGVARENETTTGRKREDLLAPRFSPGMTTGNSLDEDNSHTSRLDRATPAELRYACDPHS